MQVFSSSERLSEVAQMVAEMLGDRQHKRSSFSLCNELGITERELRDIVRNERLQGAPICAETVSKSDCGYYLGSAEDIERNRLTLARKANEIRRVWRAMGETAKKLKEQAEKRI